MLLCLASKDTNQLSDRLSEASKLMFENQFAGSRSFKLQRLLQIAGAYCQEPGKEVEADKCKAVEPLSAAEQCQDGNSTAIHANDAESEAASSLLGLTSIFSPGQQLLDILKLNVAPSGLSSELLG